MAILRSNNSNNWSLRPVEWTNTLVWSLKNKSVFGEKTTFVSEQVVLLLMTFLLAQFQVSAQTTSDQA